MTLDSEIFDWNSIILGLLATCLFAECIVLYVRAHSLKNKMETDAENIRKEEFVKFEKRRNELEMLMKERELELKSEYEDMLSAVRVARREQEEKLAQSKSELVSAQNLSKRAESEYARFMKMKEDYSKAFDAYVQKLSELSKLDESEIRERAKAEIEKKCLQDLSSYREELLEESQKKIEEKAREILMTSMQRLAPALSQEGSTCIVKIPNEAIKGRLIGKDGRNIRSFESETAATLVIDESPDSVMLSCFNPTRREIARRTLEILIADGRINPSSIEVAAKSAKDEVEQRAYDAGLKAAENLGLARVHPEILSCVGKLDFHLSMNQNSLSHSLETAALCAMLAAELDCDPSIAKKVGLFHDIGKVSPNSDLPHALAGAKILEKYGESEIICNAVASHHGEVPAKSVYASILQIADALSATRPGARMEAADGYIQRIKTLEEIAMSFDGVANAYVIQAGRELRAIVSPENVSDIEAAAIARGIREKIESCTNSGIPVKVTIIRESRFVETAKAGNAEA